MLDQLTQRYDAFVASTRRNPDAGSARASASVFEAGFAEQSRADESARVFREFEADQAREAAASFQALEASINPVVRAERELAAAQAIVNRAVQQGQATNTQAARVLAELENRYESLVRSQSPAAQSAAAIERALEEEERAVRALMLAVDPAARAHHQLEQAQEQLNRAVRNGIITQEEASRALALFEARQQQVNASGMTMGGGIQNASYQVTDFVVHVQAGQDAALALAQQLPQLLGGFGMVGAVIGMVVAVGAPLISLFLGAEDAAGSLDDRLQRLDASLGGVKENLLILRDEDLSSTFGNMTGDIRSMTEELLKLERAAELKSLREAMDKLLTENIDVGFWQSAGGVLQDALPVGGFNPAQREKGQRVQNYADLTGGRGPSYDDFEARRAEIDALAKAGNVKAVAAEINGLIREFTAGGPVSDLSDELQTTLTTLGKIARQTAEVEAQFNMTAIAAEVWDSAVGNVVKIWDEAVVKGKEMRAEGEERIRIAENELSLAQVIAKHGEDSREAEAERDRIARENYELELERAGIYEADRDLLMEISDQQNGVTDATARWADVMSGVRGEIEGIMAAIASLGGGLIDRAAKNAELKALEGGATIAEAAARGKETRRNAQYNARKSALGGGLFGDAVAGVESWWNASGDALDANLSEARSAARKRDNKGRGGGGGGSNGLGAISSVKDEMARLKPSLEADIAAAEAWRDKALAALKKGKEGYDQYATDVEEIFQERMAAAYKADLDRRDDWAAGGARALIELEEGMTSWADFTEDVVLNFAQAGEDAFTKFVTTGKASIGDFVDFVAEAFARLAYQQMLMPALNMGLSAIIGAIAPGLAPAAGAAAGAALPTNHTGSPGVIRSYSFAGYGDTMRPDERLTMTKRGEEIMTSRALENAGALISSLSALAAQSAQPVQIAPVPVQIITNTSVPLQVEERETTGPQGGRQQQFVLSEAVATGMRTRGGAARRSMERDFGMQETGIRR